MKFYYIVLSVNILFLSLCASKQPEIAHEIISFNLKEIHEAVFDLYFPDDAQLSTTEKKKRIEWRETLWVYLQDKPEIIELLHCLQPTLPFLPEDIKVKFSDIITKGINNISKERIQELQYSLRRHPDSNVRKFAALLRRVYSYLTYASPLTSKISGCSDVPSTNVVTIPYVLPTTKLQYVDNTIIHQEGEIDYLIVGSGPAGSLIANTLIKQKPGCRVVLIDSGSFIQPKSIITESLSELMESRNMRTTTAGGIIVRNGEAFGGGTIVNLDLAFSPLLPQIKKQIQSWIDADLLDRSLIHQQGNDWKNLQDAYTYVIDQIGTRTVDPDEVNANNKILLAATPTATTYDLNARKSLHDADKNLKISALEAFIVPALSQGLSIIPDVKAKKIFFDDKRTQALGIEIEFQHASDNVYAISDPNNFNAVEAQTAYIRAKNIIICAGSLGSAELLLRSEVNNNNIGKGIVLHPSMAMYGRFDKEIDILKGLSASVYAPAQQIEDGYFFESMSADPTFVALINPGSGKQILDIIRDVKYLSGFGIMLIDSVCPDNKVFIDANNKIQVDYTLSEYDKERLRKGIIRGLEMLFEQGSYEVHIPSCEPLLTQNEQYIPFSAKDQIVAAINKLQFIENENFISSAHMQGSNKMGNNPETSVVSLNFKVWNQVTGQELDNVYVCDSSIFPTSIGANPMQSIYTFAKLFIDRHIKNSCS